MKSITLLRYPTPAQVLTGLNHLRVNGHFCDVTLCVGGQEFFCHKIVLASFSSYFHAMFTGNLAESSQDRVTLTDIEAPVMELLVNYGIHIRNCDQQTECTGITFCF